MTDFFLSKNHRQSGELQESKPWEKALGWGNPFAADDGEESLAHERQENRKQDRKHRKKKKKRSSRRHRMTEEEYSELSSKADTMLDDILGDDEEPFSGGPAHRGANPFEDMVPEEEDLDGNEINQEEFSALMRGETPASKNPFGEEDPEDLDDSTMVTAKPFSAEAPDTKHLDEESVEASSEAAHFNSAIRNSGSLSNEILQHQTTDTMSKSDDESEEEDVVESSKRLLRMADERMQYQHHNDEVKRLRETIERMNHQAEAMSEQLRRAVETKCDLVVAQTEMERCHEQNLIAKDDEIKDIKRYTQELVDYQANNELNFMNEISSLSKRLEDMTEKHRVESAEKDALIAELQDRLHAMTPKTVNEQYGTGMHIETFRNRFMATKEGSRMAPIALE